MTRTKIWYIGLFIFLGFIIVGGMIGFIFMSYWNLHPTLLPPIAVQDQSKPVRGVVGQKNNSYTDQPKSLHQQGISFKNPFVRPRLFQSNPNQIQVVPRKRNLLVYQGIIETENRTLALVTFPLTQESLVVYEGEELVGFGIRIEKITAQTLTYSKDGIETVISLGGIEH